MENEESTREMMERKGVSVATVRRWMRMGMPSTLRYVGLKKQRRFDRAAVDAWLRERNLNR